MFMVSQTKVEIGSEFAYILLEAESRVVFEKCRTTSCITVHTGCAVRKKSGQVYTYTCTQTFIIWKK